MRIALKGEPGPYDPCPCGSGAKGKFCCRTASHWFKPPVEPSINKHTGYANPNCFASLLEACCEEPSKEHVIPRAVLEVSGTHAIHVKGVRWLKGEEKMIGTSALTAGVSCKRHNSSSSRFDDTVTMVFKALRTFHQEPWEPPNSGVRLVSGPDLERGLLKMLMCVAAAGWLNEAAGVVRLAQGDPVLLDMLYGGGDLAMLAGVYFLQPRQMIETRDAVDLTLLFDQADRLAIVGMAVTMVGISIAIALKPLCVQGPPTSPYREAWRRPSQVTLCDNGCEKSLLLSWPAEFGGDSTPVFADRRDIGQHAIAA